MVVIFPDVDIKPVEVIAPTVVIAPVPNDNDAPAIEPPTVIDPVVAVKFPVVDLISPTTCIPFVIPANPPTEIEPRFAICNADPPTTPVAVIEAELVLF